MKTTEDFKRDIIEAARAGVEELIKVLKEPIITHSEEDISADRLKNACATKKLAMTDAFEMIARIDVEQTNLNEGSGIGEASNFTEKFAKK